MTISAYIGDPYNNCFGTTNWTNGISTFNITPIAQEIYYCASPMSLYNYCKRNSIPDEFSTNFNLSVIIQSCISHPNGQIITPSYALPYASQYPFVSFLSCIPANSQGNTFWYYYGNGVTTSAISLYLQQIVNSIGARAYIVETDTNFLIAGKLKPCNLKK